MRNMEEQNAALRAQNEALRDTCATMAQEVKENASLFRSILEQNKSISQEAYNAVLNEMKQVQISIKDLQVRLMMCSSKNRFLCIFCYRFLHPKCNVKIKIPESEEVNQFSTYDSIMFLLPSDSSSKYSS